MAKKGSILLNLADLGAKKVKDVLFYLQDPDELLIADRGFFERIASLKQDDIDKLLLLGKSDRLDKELELIEKERITCLDIFDKDYPYLLKQISSPPLVIYVKGDKTVLAEPLFAVVGSRESSSYGLKIASDFSYKLSCLGVVVVSGLARGIDTAAHQAAINKGRSIAVLGSGLLNIYPRENKRLAQSISEKGAVISEFPLFTSPLRENFPRRNRIVSGLSRGVLVVEAALRSGALITARLACEQDREVFAVPGKIDSVLSQGTNRLIKEGAKLVSSLEDMLEELNIDFKIRETADALEAGLKLGELS